MSPQRPVVLERANLSPAMQTYISKGPLRVLELQDGHYVVGLGDIIPVDGRQAGIDKIADLELLQEQEVTVDE